MRLDHEFLADRRAARGFGPLRSYASSLLELATPSSERVPPPSPSPKATEQSGSALFLRVLMLVQGPFPVEPNPPSVWAWSPPRLVLLGTLAASCISRRATQNMPSTISPSAPGSLPRTFQVARLVVAAGIGGPQGSTAIFELPLRLPEHFDLSVDVWGDHATLAQCRVVGYRLRTPSSGSASLLENWHRVRVRRDAHGVSL